MENGVAVDLRAVSKRFGDALAVDNLSLQIGNGEFFSLLGPSGCGKTTTLRMVAGFELPSEGEIIIAGESVGAKPPYRRHVNTVFQNYALFPHMTVAQNVGFGLRMQRAPKSEVGKWVKDALQMVRLEQYADRYPKQLSGGQQQRVALARALINRPAVLLLDEPLGALDQKLRKELQLELRGLQERLGVTFVFVTHDQEEALTMSDRIGVMSGGKLLQVGTPSEIYERPSCHFVADFIGETNFLRGDVLACDGGRATVRVNGDLVVQGLAARPMDVGCAATVSVRPEKALLCDERPANTPNVFPVMVSRVVYIGSDTRIHVHMGGEQRFTVLEANTRSVASAEERFAQGKPAYLTWPAESALVFAE
ncbi:ABC transporter ATP-binding protein [Chloroflexia bacterium SDU3-3]|nr:ABC transporter ATP-binding protein [Chloroflexia bacterium SDU3-3]